jgi:hypothetical protein
VSAGGRTARNGVGEALGAAAPGDRLRRSREAPVVPEPGLLRPLARALIDLALALQHEDEEDERWTR